MTSRETSLVNLARKMMLTAKQTIALPTTITVAAGKVGMNEADMIAAALSNSALCQYLANACRVAMA